ncbi:helix-turn-helix domain-containing protein [Moraxella bovoculi]|uniref:transcriptional regulator n=1 Tax=Moraxella bovoculi TaxID=386891 RepID=UPI00156E8E11|nr:Cro/CI family transcriptional regulator [Moraxella bovoculi]NSM11357.1 helix-turn-helix domain-containing protein [Moraxella bovoculi]
MEKTPLERAISILGSTSALARAIGITPWAVSKWDKNAPPKDRCLDIEQVTQGQITAEQLRPDINWDYIRKSGK